MNWGEKVIAFISGANIFVRVLVVLAAISVVVIIRSIWKIHKMSKGK